MTTFEEYFEEHHLPLIFDDGDIELLSGYRVGHAYYDEFEEYLPILNVLKTINNQFPEFITDGLENLNEYSLELNTDGPNVIIELSDDELSITQKHHYMQLTIVHKDEGQFKHVNTIQFTNGPNLTIDKLNEWLDSQNKYSQSIVTLLTDTNQQLQTTLTNAKFNTEVPDFKSDEFSYRRIGNAGNLKELVEQAKLGKLLKRPGYDGVLIQTSDGWLIDCLDYQKDGKRFIRTEIFWDQSNESTVPNYKREYAVKGLSEAYQMIPAERFKEHSQKLLTNLQEFSKLCLTQTEVLDTEFQLLDTFDLTPTLTPEDLAWEIELLQ